MTRYVQRRIVEPIPIDLSQACRTSGATGSGTPGTGIGEAGDPTAALGANRATPAVAIFAPSYGYGEPIPEEDSRPLTLHENQRGEISLHTMPGTLNSGGGKPGQGYPAVYIPTEVIPLSGDTAAGRSGDANTPSMDGAGRVRLRRPGLGIGNAGDPSFTVTSSQAPGVCYSPEVASTLTAGVAAAPGVSVPGRRSEDDTNIVAVAVDGRDGSTHELTHTLTSNGDTSRTSAQRTGTIFVPDHEGPLDECGCCPYDPKPDSARYRAIGNACTVNVIDYCGWLLESGIDWG